MIGTDATVFVVDDDPSVRKSLLRLIRSGGWRGEAFGSAREFLARPSFSGTGCLILDVRMPGMTGPELCRAMAERKIFLPVIFLTAHSDIPPDISAWYEGKVDFLAKPVEAEVLLQAVQLALESHSKMQTRKK